MRPASGGLARLRDVTRETVGQMRRDVSSVVERDPAARNALEVTLLYPGVHAVWAHRVSHAMWRRGALLPARALSQAARLVTGIEIHPAARIGPGLFIDHGAGVVIGETAEVGCDVTLYHGVTLGGTSLKHGKRHPTIGDRVTVGAGAKVLGPLTVGDDSRIGANAVLVRSVDSHSVVVGVPGQVIAHGTPDEVDTSPKQDSPSAPDPVGSAVSSLLERMAHLESHVLGEESHAHEVPRRTATGDWHLVPESVDFSI